MVNPVKKGKDGEREAAKWLACNLKLAKTPERILEQPRSGGFDLLVPPFAIEVKRDQVLTLRSWWVKLLADLPPGLAPLLMFRRNRQKWRFAISANTIGLKTGYVVLEEFEMKAWAFERVHPE